MFTRTGRRILEDQVAERRAELASSAPSGPWLDGSGVAGMEYKVTIEGFGRDGCAGLGWWEMMVLRGSDDVRQHLVLWMLRGLGALM